MTKPARFFRKVITDTRGAEIAEAAAVLPLMFLILLGIFWFGQAFSIYGAITRAAQEGARAGSIPYCITCTGSSGSLQAQTNAANAAQAAMLASQLDPSLVRNPVPPPSLFVCDTQTTAACSSGSNPYNFCVQTPVLLSSTTGVGTMPVCGVSVSFQYPFQFWLPFTSLNKQTIWISANARMHKEYR